METIKETDGMTFVNFWISSFKTTLSTEIDTALAQIEKFDIIRLGNELVNSLVEHNQELTRQIEKLLKDINRAVDKLVAKNEFINQYYNLVAVRFLYDIMFQRERDKKHFDQLWEEYLQIFDNKNYTAIVEALLRYSSLTQSELAQKTSLSPQNLSKYLSKVKNQKIIIAFKTPINRKKTYYKLNRDFYEYIIDKGYMPLSDLEGRKKMLQAALLYPSKKMQDRMDRKYQSALPIRNPSEDYKIEFFDYPKTMSIAWDLKKNKHIFKKGDII